jgi:hypothetical protein
MGKGRIENLTHPRWKKGESGNPGGRPKRLPITDEYRNLADQPLPEKLRARIQKKFGVKLSEDATWSSTVSLRLFLQAIGEKPERGAARSAKEIREATEGKALQRIELMPNVKTVYQILIKYDRSPRRKLE